MAQLVTRVGETLVDRVDSLVAAGLLASRSEAVRLALEDLVERLEREEIGRQIVDAYTRMPQTDEEIRGVDEAFEQMLAEESW
jgi:Arc/MetJ-type ribon-helix-helix transcriptional regulator